MIDLLEAAIAEVERVALETQGCDCGRCSYELVWLLKDDWVTELNLGVAHTSAPGFINQQQARHVVLNCPERVLRRVARDRKLLDLHRPTWEMVEWPHAAPGVEDRAGMDKGKNWVCPSCRPAEPTEWHPPFGRAGVLPDGFVPSYTLAPCPSLTVLFEDYQIEVPK